MTILSVLLWVLWFVGGVGGGIVGTCGARGVLPEFWLRWFGGPGVGVGCYFVVGGVWVLRWCLGGYWCCDVIFWWVGAGGFCGESWIWWGV